MFKLFVLIFIRESNDFTSVMLEVTEYGESFMRLWVPQMTQSNINEQVIYETYCLLQRLSSCLDVYKHFKNLK